MMKKARVDARALIESVGARATLARVSVLAELIDAGRPLSHQEVLQRIDPPLDRVTAYRVFEWLEASKLVHRVNTSDRVTCFSVSRASPCQAHFQCECCGRVFCLSEAPLVEGTLPTGFVMRSVETTIKGVCANCVEKQRGA